MGQAHGRCADSVAVACADSKNASTSGFSAGQTVYFTGARQVFSNGDTLEFGLAGEIICGDDQSLEHVRVRFRDHADFTNARTSDLSRQPPTIPGGFEIGDRVYWNGEAEKFPSGDRLRPGMAGEVVGCSSLEDAAADNDCLAVHFDGNGKITDVLIASLSKTCPVKKCAPGERVYFTGARQSFVNGDSLCFGMPGKVIALKAVSADEIRMAVQFDGNQLATPVSLAQVSRSPPTIPGGYEVGDVVQWKGKPQTLASGDRLEAGKTGEIVGRPGARFDGKDDERVLVQFEDHSRGTPCLLSSIMRASSG